MDNIVNFRTATYEEIANYLGISRQAVGKKMHGSSQFTLKEVMKLYEVYGITIHELSDIIQEETQAYRKKKEYGLWQRK